MTEKVFVVDPENSLAEAAQKMRYGDFGALPVCESDRLVGMLTDRDITTRAVAEGKDPDETRVRDVMTGEVLYCFEDEDTDDVARNMGENQVRRLLVINRDKRLVGIVALSDLARSQENPDELADTLSEISEDDHREPQQASA